MSSYRRVIHLGIVHPMAFPSTGGGQGPVVETVSQIARDEFFSAIELRPTLDAETREAVRKVVAESGILPIVSGQPPLLGGKHDLNSADEAVRQAAVACVKASIDEAVVWGAPYVAILSGRDVEEAERPAAIERLVRSLSECCAYAREVSEFDPPIHISLEQFDFDVEKRCLVGPIEVAVEVIEATKAAGNANIGLLVDLSHLPLLRETAEDNLQLAAPHLIHVHVGSAFLEETTDPAYGDQHPRFGYPGGLNEVADLAHFFEVLGEVGYYDKDLPTGKPVVTFEVKPMPGESSELVIAGTKRAFYEAWASVSTEGA